MRRLDAGGVLLPLRRSARIVPEGVPDFRAHFAADRLGAPFLEGMGLRHLAEEEGGALFLPVGDRVPGQRIVVVAQGPGAVFRVVAVVRSGGIAHEEPGAGEGAQIGVHDLLLDRLAGEPVVMGLIVPLAPEAEHPDGEEADARVAVVARAEGGDELRHRRAQAGILVVRRDAPAVVALLVVGMGLQAGVQQVARGAGGRAGIVEIDAEDGWRPRAAIWARCLSIGCQLKWPGASIRGASGW